MDTGGFGGAPTMDPPSVPDSGGQGGTLVNTGTSGGSGGDGMGGGSTVPMMPPDTPLCVGRPCDDDEVDAAVEHARAEMEAEGKVVDATLWEDPERYQELFLRTRTWLGDPVVLDDNTSPYGKLTAPYSSALKTYDPQISYCGPGTQDTRGSGLFAQIARKIFPGDCLNRICRQHDRCYDNIGSLSLACVWSSQTGICDRAFETVAYKCDDLELCDQNCKVTRRIAAKLSALQSFNVFCPTCTPKSCEDFGAQCGYVEACGQLEFCGNCENSNVQCDLNLQCNHEIETKCAAIGPFVPGMGNSCAANLAEYTPNPDDPSSATRVVTNTMVSYECFLNPGAECSNDPDCMLTLGAAQAQAEDYRLLVESTYTDTCHHVSCTTMSDSAAVITMPGVFNFLGYYVGSPGYCIMHVVSSPPGFYQPYG